MPFLSEAELESVVLSQLKALGYPVVSDAVIGPDGSSPERDSYGDVILVGRLKGAIDRLNPHIPAGAREDALRKILGNELPNLTEENRRLHALMVQGVTVEFSREDGTIAGDQVRLVDFDNLQNDWLVSDQFTVIEGGVNRRADVVLFLNGLPVGVIELKAPGSENATLSNAHSQLQTYKTEIKSLFRTNAILVISDGIAARIGSLTADHERFMPWRTTDGQIIAPKGQPELTILLEGVFEQTRFLELMKDFTVFGDTGSELAKILAGYHQFHAVKRAVASTLRALALNAGQEAGLYGGLREDPAGFGLPGVASHPKGDKRIGVIWHTQGSGKSLLMAFYAGQLVRRPELQNPTIVVLTDRNDLDEQLFKTFAMCRDLIGQTPVRAESRADLQKQLQRASGGVVFTTIQKFSPETGQYDYPLLSDRANVVVIADEAHRSQYGLGAKFNQASGDKGYGFAKYVRDALPNASFIGFTGTPIENGDVNTPAVFGDYIDIYDISRAVEDGATVPIYYESRLARIELADEEKPKLDDEMEELTEHDEQSEQERIKRKWATIEALVGSKNRLKLIAADIVTHFENRSSGLDGKGMTVCMSRRICVALYNEIITLRPQWHSDHDHEGVVKVVMTGSASDPPEWQQHIRSQARREDLAKRAKKADDPLKLVIVRDMWLTGFDAPSMHTMYVDKPMRGHGLMQAIARVNRVFRDKPAGLIVDYIGIAQSLKNALGQYSASDQRQTGIDEAQAVAQLLERYDVVKSMFHGFDYLRGVNGPPHERLVVLAGAMDWILTLQQEAAAREAKEDDKKKQHRRYQDAVLALSKAFALASASDDARRLRDEIAFFQAVRAALTKSVTSGGNRGAGKDFAIQQLLDRAVLSTEIVDILGAAGLATPDISIMSDEFLGEIQQLQKKNLAIEALKKLLNGEVTSRLRTNIVESRRFSERLEGAIARYHTNAISTVEVLQELIDLAKEIRAAKSRGEEEGLSQDEIAFYDALADNESAVQVMGNDALKVIAHELLVSLQNNATVDWSHRQSARASMRRLVKRILRKYGYPPDLEEGAVITVISQAETLASRW